MSQEFEAAPPSMPFISERVKEQIAQETPRDSLARVPVGEELAESVLIDVAQVNYPLVEAIATTLKENEESGSHHRIDGFTKGVAIVLRAFDLETENRLIGKLERLDEDDIAEMQTLIRHGDSMSQYSVPIIERVLAQPRIPEQQVNLRQAVNQVASTTDFSETKHLQTGAAVMFKVLSKHWGKLMSG